MPDGEEADDEEMRGKNVVELQKEAANNHLFFSSHLVFIYGPTRQIHTHTHWFPGNKGVIEGWAASHAPHASLIESK